MSDTLAFTIWAVGTLACCYYIIAFYAFCFSGGECAVWPFSHVADAMNGKKEYKEDRLE